MQWLRTLRWTLALLLVRNSTTSQNVTWLARQSIVLMLLIGCTTQRFKLWKQTSWTCSTPVTVILWVTDQVCLVIGLVSVPALTWEQSGILGGNQRKHSVYMQTPLRVLALVGIRTGNLHHLKKMFNDLLFNLLCIPCLHRQWLCVSRICSPWFIRFLPRWKSGTDHFAFHSHETWHVMNYDSEMETKYRIIFDSLSNFFFWQFPVCVSHVHF